LTEPSDGESITDRASAIVPKKKMRRKVRSALPLVVDALEL